jgi:hypothetical protein
VCGREVNRDIVITTLLLHRKEAVNIIRPSRCIRSIRRSNWSPKFGLKRNAGNHRSRESTIPLNRILIKIVNTWDLLVKARPAAKCRRGFVIQCKNSSAFWRIPSPNSKAHHSISLRLHNGGAPYFYWSFLDKGRGCDPPRLRPNICPQKCKPTSCCTVVFSDPCILSQSKVIGNKFNLY